MPHPILDDVRQVAADVLQVPLERLHGETSRDDLPQWDSLHHVNLVIALEQTFDVQFTPEHVEQMLTLELIAMLIDELRHADRTPHA
jgi:acyl carrier protein